MKKILSIMATVALSLGVSTAVSAQERENTSAYNFIGLQGGAQMTLTHYQLDKLITPQYAIQFGRYFNDKVGARLHVMGFENKGGFEASRFPFLAQDEAYKFKGCTADLDLLMNMTNIISPNRVNRNFDWVLLAGFGANYTWDYDEFNCITAKNNQGNYYDGAILNETKRNSFNGRLGTQFNYNVCNAFTVGLELQANYKNDCYNLKYNDQCDWQTVAFLGVTYKFGQPKAKKVVATDPEPIYETRVDTVWYDDVTYKAVLVEEKIERACHFSIRQDNPIEQSVINEICNFVNSHKDVKMTVTGYADKGTGNAKLNMGYSEKRATTATKVLTDAGISADIITTEWKGDTVQPFEENDLNRVAIIVATGMGEKKEKVATKKFRLDEKKVRVN